MMDFEKSKEHAFEELSKIFSIEKTTAEIKTQVGYTKKINQWKVILEVPLPDKVTEFTVFLELKSDFPLSIPIIYLSEDDYEKVKYIPHIDDRRNICLFDQENIKLDADRPTDIIKACLKRAGQIISDGINKVNTGDFRDEIVAYWTNVYDVKDQVFEAYMGEGIESLTPGVHIGYLLLPAYHNVDFFMGTDSSESQKVIDFFRLRGHKVTEQPFFYLGEVTDLKPPFYFDNKTLVNFFRDKFKAEWVQVKGYLNQGFGSKIFSISLKIKGELLFFGFYISSISQKINGWRKQSLTALNVLETIQPTKSVARIAFKYFSQSRLHQRTDGIPIVKSPKKFMLAGLGSIGSNLLFHLSSMEVSDFVLCDPDILALENVNRHLLSFNDVGELKVDALTKYLSFNNPFLNVTKNKGSIIDMIRTDIALINSMDILFCALGKDAIEEYILQCLNDGTITRPVMLFWVEPYLLGGHAIYINPSTGFSLRDVEDAGYYRYNIISSETYSDPNHQLLLQEAGCQGSYVPYGKAAITLFFANIVPQLYSVIERTPQKNIVFSYAGDIPIATAKGFLLSTFGKTFTSNQLMINTI